RLHGARRAASNDPFALEGDQKPGEMQVEVGGVRVKRGSIVRLHPRRKADAMDMFLEGELARVEGVFCDVEGAFYVAVTIASDPGQDLHASFGRYFYFYPDEIEPQQE